jgi:hypothetical protein
VFDADAAANPNVGSAEWHVAETLTGKGAVVKVVRLAAGEPGPDGTAAKVGLDDYLVAHGPDAFRKLLNAAVDPAPPVPAVPNEARTIRTGSTGRRSPPCTSKSRVVS